MKSLYVGSKACITVGNKVSEWFPVGGGEVMVDRSNLVDIQQNTYGDNKTDTNYCTITFYL